jgi:hypothetical protein
MQLEVPMIAKFKAEFDAKLEVDSFVDGSIRVWGPKDKDKDGDPEICYKVDLPGESFDFEGCVEIPIATALGGIPGIALAVVEKGGDFPFKNMVMKSIKQALDAITGG